MIVEFCSLSFFTTPTTIILQTTEKLPSTITRKIAVTMIRVRCFRVCCSRKTLRWYGCGWLNSYVFVRRLFDDDWQPGRKFRTLVLRSPRQADKDCVVYSNDKQVRVQSSRALSRRPVVIKYVRPQDNVVPPGQRQKFKKPYKYCLVWSIINTEYIITNIDVGADSFAKPVFHLKVRRKIVQRK